MLGNYLSLGQLIRGQEHDVLLFVTGRVDLIEAAFMLDQGSTTLAQRNSVHSLIERNMPHTKNPAC